MKIEYILWNIQLTIWPNFFFSYIILYLLFLAHFDSWLGNDHRETTIAARMCIQIWILLLRKIMLKEKRYIKVKLIWLLLSEFKIKYAYYKYELRIFKTKIQLEGNFKVQTLGGLLGGLGQWFLCHTKSLILISIVLLLFYFLAQCNL